MALPAQKFVFPPASPITISTSGMKSSDRLSSGWRRVKWTPLSRPNLARNKLTSDGSESVYCGRPQHRSRPLPFRRPNRRSGRIPAEPYLPFGYLQCTASHSGPKALNPRGSGTASPTSAKLLILIDCSFIVFITVPGRPQRASDMRGSGAAVPGCRTGDICRSRPVLPSPTRSPSGIPPRI